ncbi:MAG: thiD [Burkholderiales bacterium]|jgi:hydroxymethylpyrimidine/phosphomethylpyrimidine kinase|nr:thiD [Burkholderiales bacterium]
MLFTHGIGCTLSAAIAAKLALGKNLLDSCIEAKQYINYALESFQHEIIGPVNHFHAIW